jgi:hypothetical protein
VNVSVEIPLDSRLWASITDSSILSHQLDEAFSATLFLLKVDRLPSKDRMLLGDMLLRDNLRVIQVER